MVEMDISRKTNACLHVYHISCIDDIENPCDVSYILLQF